MYKSFLGARAGCWQYSSAALQFSQLRYPKNFRRLWGTCRHPWRTATVSHLFIQTTLLKLSFSQPLSLSFKTQRMGLKIYQVDAFTNKLFGGNPAAVIPLETWLSADLMQKIALENNLSETVFFVANQTGFDIRWFTPEVEINLCGHATLASAFILFEKLGYEKENIVFQSASGPLSVTKKDSMLVMDFPSWEPKPIVEIDPNLSNILGGITILEIHRYRDILVLLENETAVKDCQPDFTLMKKHFNKMIITAKGDEVDFVSRFFAPAAGVNEDPVTGSAHSQLIPFWSKRLNKIVMNAKQLSHRGGNIYCEQNGERVVIGGHCVFYMQGEITMDNGLMDNEKPVF